MDYKIIFSRWDIEFKNILDTDIQGSPERSIFRKVIGDIHDNRYILEEISLKHKERKEAISEMLTKLKIYNINVEPYIKAINDEYIIKHENRYYQVQRFIEGTNLPRPEYIKDGWRGKELATFLLKIKKLNMPSNNDFDMISYIKNAYGTIKKYFPDIYNETIPIIDFLDNNMFKMIDQLPLSFCHGDYHPINVIWGEYKINSVIDWEFFGAKPELYDAANMLGCVGIENPHYLTDKLAMTFISELKKGNFDPKSWEYLIDLIVANRFAWLSEWCRKDDKEMQELEITFMKILINSKNDLMKIWNIKDQ
jgi:homoserine kinase type II